MPEIVNLSPAVIQFRPTEVKSLEEFKADLARWRKELADANHSSECEVSMDGGED